MAQTLLAVEPVSGGSMDGYNLPGVAVGMAVREKTDVAGHRSVATAQLLRN